MTPTRIVITGDIFRPDAKAKKSSQDANIRWMKGLFEPCLEQASGLPVEIVSVEAIAEDITALYAGLGMQLSLESWAQIYESLPEDLAQRIAPFFERSFVVGFELPPSLMVLFQARGVPYIDVVLHPVRYMQDLLLGFASNLSEVEARLGHYCMSSARPHRATGIMRAFAARFAAPPVPADSVLFIGQTSRDRSMISQGRFLRPEDYMADLIDRVRARSNHGTVLFKPHPIERNPAVLEALQATDLEIVEPEAPVYTLLPSGLVSSVVSVSSSVGEEARFFGLDADYGLSLSTPVRYREDLGQADRRGYLSIYDAFLATDFWRDVLAPALPVTAPDGLPAEGAPNLLRTTLRSYWGYEAFAFDSHIRLGPKWAGTYGADKTRRILGSFEACVRGSLRRFHRWLRH